MMLYRKNQNIKNNKPNFKNQKQMLMKKSFQCTNLLFGMSLMVLILISQSGFAQSADNSQSTVQATGLSATVVVDAVANVPAYQNGVVAYDNPAVVNQQTGLVITDQSSNSTSEQKKPVNGNEGMLMNPTSESTKSIKMSNGIAEISKDGTVKVTSAQGEVKTYAKPVMNLTQPVGYMMDEYIANYKAWVKANPEFKKNVTNQELQFIAQDDYEGLYKSNYYYNQKLSLNK